MSNDTVFSGIHEVTIDLPTASEEAPGLVLKWRRRGAMLEGLVSREVDGRVVTEWLPALLLAPGTSTGAAGDIESVGS